MLLYTKKEHTEPTSRNTETTRENPNDSTDPQLTDSRLNHYRNTVDPSESTRKVQRTKDRPIDHVQEYRLLLPFVSVRVSVLTKSSRRHRVVDQRVTVLRPSGVVVLFSCEV